MHVGFVLPSRAVKNTFFIEAIIYLQVFPSVSDYSKIYVEESVSEFLFLYFAIRVVHC